MQDMKFFSSYIGHITPLCIASSARLDEKSAGEARMAVRTGLFFLFLGILVLNDAFNLDTHVPIVKEGRGDAYFGFAVTQHQVYRHQTGSSEHV